MNEPRERLFWFIALTLSITAHVAFVLLMPVVTAKPDIKPIMRVRLAMVEKKSAPAQPPIREEVPAEKKVLPKEDTVPQKQPQKKAEPAKAVKTALAKAPLQEVQAIAETADSEAGTSVIATNEAVPTDNLPDSPPQARPERVVELNTLEVVKKVLPDYSSFSRKRKEEGTVKIIATVTDGRVVSAEVESSSGYPRLDESALRAVRQWLFKNKGTVRVRVPVVFRLK